MFRLPQSRGNGQITPGWGKCSKYPRIGKNHPPPLRSYLHWDEKSSFLLSFSVNNDFIFYSLLLLKGAFQRLILNWRVVSLRQQEPIPRHYRPHCLPQTDQATDKEAWERWWQYHLFQHILNYLFIALIYVFFLLIKYSIACLRAVFASKASIRGTNRQTWNTYNSSLVDKMNVSQNMTLQIRVSDPDLDPLDP
jgi:hypothetical protein